jgi:hypothetical protein
MSANRILHLHLEREWFDDIAEGRKRYEYRAYKEYWKKRLEGREFDIVRFATAMPRTLRKWMSNLFAWSAKGKTT